MVGHGGQGNWTWIIIASLLLDIVAMKYAHLRTELASDGWY